MNIENTDKLIENLKREIQNIKNSVEIDSSTELEDPDMDLNDYQVVVFFEDGFRKVLPKSINLEWEADLETFKWYLNLESVDRIELISPTLEKTLEKFEDGSYSAKHFYYAILIDDGEITVLNSKL